MATPNPDGRLYVVESEDSLSVVRAKTQTAAFKHVVQSTYTVRAATADDVADFLGQGGEIEVAGQEATEQQVAQEPEAGEE